MPLGKLRQSSNMNNTHPIRSPQDRRYTSQIQKNRTVRSSQVFAKYPTIARIALTVEDHLENQQKDSKNSSS
jgi:hypothetical protein